MSELVAWAFPIFELSGRRSGSAVVYFSREHLDNLERSLPRMKQMLKENPQISCVQFSSDEILVTEQTTDALAAVLPERAVAEIPGQQVSRIPNRPQHPVFCADGGLMRGVLASLRAEDLSEFASFYTSLELFYRTPERAEFTLEYRMRGDGCLFISPGVDADALVEASWSLRSGRMAA